MNNPDGWNREMQVKPAELFSKIMDQLLKKSSEHNG